MKFLKDMKNSVYGETMKNVMQHRNIKLVTTNSKISRLKTKQNYHRMKWFLKNLLAIKMNKAEAKMSKLIFLDLSVLDSQKATYDYCNDILIWGQAKTMLLRYRQFNSISKIGRYLGSPC